MKPELINNFSLLKTFLDGLNDISGEPPTLYIDLEGNNLSRHGTLSLMTILIEPREKVYLIDVTKLGRDAFDTVGLDGRSVRNILEARDIIKVFFDIRNDSDALYSLFGIHVRGIWDLQLMELASRNFQKKCVNGLAKCIERDSHMEYAEKAKWQRGKDKGRDLFDPARGGSYAVFDQRPLSPEMEDYCVQDVAFMPHLCEIYRARLCDAWWRKIEAETEERIRISHGPAFNGKGRHMAEGPSGWIGWSPHAAELKVRTLLTVPVRRSMPETSTKTQLEDDVRSPTRQPPADLTKLFEDMKLKGVDTSHDSDSDEGDRHRTNIYCSGEYDGERDEAKDLTACDSECGYCGTCQY